MINRLSKIREISATICSNPTAGFVIWTVFILVFLGFHVLKYFIVPVLWAAIIAYMTATLSVYPADVRPAFKYQCVCHDCSDYFGHWYSLTFAIFILQHEGRNLYYELQRQIFPDMFLYLILSASYLSLAKKLPGP